MLAGAGVGLVNPPLASTAVGVVPTERSGMASGINSTFRQVGIATGIAGLGAVFQHSVTQRTTTALLAGGHAREILGAAHGQLGDDAGVRRSDAGSRTSLSPAARAALEHSYRVGFTGAFTTIAAIAAVVALVGARARLRAGAQHATSSPPESCRSLRERARASASAAS